VIRLHADDGRTGFVRGRNGDFLLHLMFKMGYRGRGALEPNLHMDPDPKGSRNITLPMSVAIHHAET